MKQLFVYSILIAWLWPNIAFGHQSCAQCPDLRFTENKGQWPSHVRYQMQFPGGNAVFLNQQGMSYDFTHPDDYQDMNAHHRGEQAQRSTIRKHHIRMHWHRSNEQTTSSAEQPSSFATNYIIGNNPSKWGVGALNYASVNMNEVYNGVHLQAYSVNGQLKYDWIVEAYAKPERIEWSYSGANAIEIDQDGRLLLFTDFNHFAEAKPYAYQDIDGQRIEVDVAFVLNDNVLSFDIGAYDSSYILVIDPTVVFSSYTGSTADNFGFTATYDDDGNAYVGGYVSNNGYPTSTGAYSTSYSGAIDMGISKFSADGANLLYSTYLGASGIDLPHSIVANSAGELFIYGSTSSNDFPTTANAYDASFNGGPNVGIPSTQMTYNGADIVVAKLSVDGSTLSASTYVGGSGSDGLNLTGRALLSANYADEFRGEILLDEQGRVYVASATSSDDFPVTGGAFQSIRGGNQDGVVFSMTDDLSTLIASSYLGGSRQDAAYSMDFLPDGSFYIAGGTNSGNLVNSPNAYQNDTLGGVDGFIYRLSANLNAVLASTYYGSSAYDQIYFVEADKQGAAYLFGQTSAPANALIRNATYNDPQGGQMLAKLNPDLTEVDFATRFGRGDGDPDISPTAFLVDLCNRVYVSGWAGNVNSSARFTSTSNGLETTSDALFSTTDGSDFYLMVLDADAGGLFYATYFGGPESSDHVDGGTSRFDKRGVVYQSVCASCGGSDDFPIFPAGGPVVSATNNSSNCNNAVFKIDFEAPLLIAEVDFDAIACAGDPIQFINQSTGVITPNYQWDFGDGNTSTQESPTHQFNMPGTYMVTLMVDEPSSCNLGDTIVKEILVLGDGQQNLEKQSICKGDQVSIGLPFSRSDAVSFTWTPSDGLSDSSSPQPVASPDSSTDYQLIVVDEGGCRDTFYQRVEVLDLGFEIAGDTVVCEQSIAQLYIELNGANPGDYNYLWSTGDTTLAIEYEVNQPGVISITVSNDINCQFVDQQFIDTLSRPNFAVLVEQNPVCSYDTVRINAITLPPSSNLSFIWNTNGEILGSSSTDQLEIHLDTSAYVYVEASNASGCESSDSVLINVVPSESSTLPAVLTCSEDSVDIGPSPNAGFTYQWLPSDGLSDANIANPKASPNQSTQYLLLVDDGNCIDTVYQQVDVPGGDIQIQGLDTLCSEDTAALILNHTDTITALSIQWTPSADIIGDDDGDTIIVAPIDQWYYVSVVDTFGCSYMDSIHVIVAAPLDISIGISDSIACETDTIQLLVTNNSVGPVHFNWSPLTNQVGGDSIQPLISTDQSTQFRLRAVNDDGCLFIDELDYLPVQLVSMQSDTVQHCLGDTVLIGLDNEAAGTAYQWLPSIELEQANAFQTLAFPSVSRTYTLLANGPYCTDTMRVPIDVKIDTVSIDSIGIQCSNQAIEIFSSQFDADNDLQYTWSGAGVFGPDNGASVQHFANDSTWVYLVAVDDFGCSYNDSAFVPVVSMDIQANAEIVNTCVDDTINLSASGNLPIGYNIVWSPNENLLGADNTDTVLLHAIASGTYYVEATFAQCVARDSISINVRNHQSQNLNDITTCEQIPVSIGITPKNDADYFWSPGIGLSDSTVSLTMALPDSSRSYVLIERLGACIDTIHQHVAVRHNRVDLSSVPIICQLQKDTVDASIAHPEFLNTASWQGNGQAVNDTQFEVNTTENTLLVYTMFTALGCQYTDTLSITLINPDSELEAYVEPDTIRRTQEAVVSAEGVGGAQYIWRGPELVSRPDSIAARVAPAENSSYHVVFTDEFGCKLRDTVQVFIREVPCDLPYVYLPNAFSPNGDGKNDVLFLRGWNVVELELKIYDRWGQLVFESNDPRTGWDGTFNGAALEPAVFAYKYVARCDNEETHERSGNITIIR